MKPLLHKAYFDCHATTAPDPAVVAEMLPYFGDSFGNAASGEHARGRAAADAVAHARALVADAIGAEAREIVFTSGATEANNLALTGGMRHLRRKGKTHLIVAQTEHKCVLESANALEAEGFRVTRLGVCPLGHIDPDELERALSPQTGLVSLMSVNNETGLIHPLAALARRVHAAGAIFHTDAAQALGKTAIDVRASGVDMLSLSAHKAYGPMGIGALFLRRRSAKGRPRVRVEPLLHGGGQEQGLRAGTLATPLIAGFGKACGLISANLPAEIKRIEGFRNRIVAALPDLEINGDRENRVVHNLNISFPGVPRAMVFEGLKGLDVSGGSACSDRDVAASHVLRALGLTEDRAKSSVRLCIGRYTQPQEIDALIEGLGCLEAKKIQAQKTQAQKIQAQKPQRRKTTPKEIKLQETAPQETGNRGA